MMEKVLFCNYIVPQRPPPWGTLWLKPLGTLKFNFKSEQVLWTSTRWRRLKKYYLEKGEATSNMSLYSDISAIFKWVIWIGNFRFDEFQKSKTFSRSKISKKKKNAQVANTVRNPLPWIWWRFVSWKRLVKLISFLKLVGHAYLKSPFMAKLENVQIMSNHFTSFWNRKKRTFKFFFVKMSHVGLMHSCSSK